MTFLRYVCERLLGPPERRRGEECWACPQCGRHRFHVRPHKPEHKDRWSCWACGWWGDEADLLRHFYPREDYGARLDRLEQLRVEHAQANPEPLIFCPGPGSPEATTRGVMLLYRLLRIGEIDWHDILEVYSDYNHVWNLVVESAVLGRGKKAEKVCGEGESKRRGDTSDLPSKHPIPQPAPNRRKTRPGKRG